MLENPVGYLQFRPYMTVAKIVRTRRRIDYCAYWSDEEANEAAIHKPTYIWTGLRNWKMKGRTGNGRCGWDQGPDCGWEHISLEKVKNPRLRNRHPQSLIAEFLQAAADSGAFANA